MDLPADESRCRLAAPSPALPMRLSILLALLAGHAAAAQTPADTLDFSDVTPEIVGGLAGLQQNIVYPAADRDAS